jgi:hypothetical protein
MWDYLTELAVRQLCRLAARCEDGRFTAHRIRLSQWGILTLLER